MTRKVDKKREFFLRFLALVLAFLLVFSVLLLVEEKNKEASAILDRLSSSELIISGSLPKIEETPSGWLIDLKSIVPQREITQLFDQSGVKLYLLKNGQPFKHSTIIKPSDLRFFIDFEDYQNDYSFFITDSRRTFTASAPRTLGNLNPKQVNKVEYRESNNLFAESLDEFTIKIRQGLLNNLRYVVKEKPPSNFGKIEGVLLIRESDDDYKTQIIFKNKLGKIVTLETPLINEWVWIKFDEAFNKHAYLWDDSFISWFAIDTDPQLAASTLDFWYSLQIQAGENKGLIPRQVRPEQYSTNFDSYHENYQIVTPLSSLPLSSPGINNPFILGRVEIELYSKIKDKNRLLKVLPHLISYYEWVEKHKKKEYILDNDVIIFYQWSNFGSGMDNSPRCEEVSDCGYVDLIAQQAALAKDISQIASITNQESIASQHKDKYQQLVNQIQAYYFDENSGFVSDLLPGGQKLEGAETIAFAWSLYAKALTKKQADKLVTNYLLNNRKFGGTPALPTVARDSLYFSENGYYWKGGIWPPLIWITYLGLIEYEYNSLANNLANTYLNLFRDSFDYYGTLFEYYSPALVSTINPVLVPGSYPDARPDFYGWSILPLIFFIELKGKN